MLKKVVAGAVLGLALTGTAAQASPARVVTTVETVASRPVERVQFFYDYEDEVYYAPPPVYRPRYRVYREQPPYGYYQPRPVYRAPGYGFYDRESAKDYVKSYRRSQKEIFKERVRAWNRAHGF